MCYSRTKTTTTNCSKFTHTPEHSNTRMNSLIFRGLFLTTRPHLGVTPSTAEDKLESKETKGEHFCDECAELLRLLNRLPKCLPQGVWRFEPTVSDAPMNNNLQARLLMGTGRKEGKTNKPQSPTESNMSRVQS